MLYSWGRWTCPADGYFSNTPITAPIAFLLFRTYLSLSWELNPILAARAWARAPQEHREGRSLLLEVPGSQEGNPWCI